jgi:hypothetical protein
LLWVLSIPAVIVSASMLLVALGGLGMMAWVILLTWIGATPVMCLPSVRLRAARGNVRFSHRSDLALVWLTAPWVVSWRMVELVAARVPLGRAALMVGPVALAVAVVLALQDDAVAPAVVLVVVGYLTVVFPFVNHRLAGPSLF